MANITLYHGSLVSVPLPLVNVGRKDLDFGQGFYVTDIRTQAEEWARTLKGRSKKQAIPVLNIYHYTDDGEQDCKVLLFPEYDKDWLEFICSSRRGERPWEGFDIIKGGIANDSVIDTVDAYMAGLIDETTALGRLTYHKPNNQICFLNQNLVNQHLIFVASENLE